MLHQAEPNDPNAQPREQLLLAVARGRDQNAFRALFRYFAPRIKGYVRQLGADDSAAEELVQDVMLTLWLKAETFDPAQASAATWVFTIVRNRRIDRIRREARPAPDPQDPALAALPPPSPEDEVLIARDGERVRTAMKTLSPEQTEALRLSYFEEKSHSEIAEERKIPLGTVKTRLRAALTQLRRSVKESA